MFGDGDRDTVGVDFLESVGADHRGRNLAGNAYQRNRIQAGVGDRGDQVGCPRSATGHTDGGFAFGARHALGDESRPLLVTRQNMADLRALA